MTTIHRETDSLGMTILYTEQHSTDYDEELGGYTPETITYRPITIKKRDCYAVGFSWAHPHGGTISGSFDKPILIMEESTADDDEPERNHYNGPTMAAIFAKLGNVSCLEDIEVDFEGRA